MAATHMESSYTIYIILLTFSVIVFLCVLNLSVVYIVEF